MNASDLFQEEIFDFLIDNADYQHVRALLLPSASYIRLYDHYPIASMDWWRVSVPLSETGPNRQVDVSGLRMTVDLKLTEFRDVLGELEKSMIGSGLTLVQSHRPLPGNLHPRGFRREDTMLRVLKKNSAALLVELPHRVETAGFTVFGRRNYDYLVENQIIEAIEGA
ncbi:hypothetical protein K1W69_19340 [Hoeflea sp. WL0058]|uniref:Uncharacterized protein n=1 Tax=Flavimaribacter sediminis TaxID=2865987 RepID=A0AAE2ZR82_9HYPH|nr:hypothetical protein [Flavimaribacter sediminis]MBW8639357.1 hypothetical protein [Flavimaribacter sediminis]